MISRDIPNIIYDHIIIEKISKNVYKNFFLQFKKLKKKQNEQIKLFNSKDYDNYFKEYRREYRKFDVSNYKNYLSKELQISHKFTLTKKECNNLLRCCKYNTKETCYSYDEELTTTVHSYFIRKVVNRMQEEWINGKWFIKLDILNFEDNYINRPAKCNPINLPHEVVYEIINSYKGFEFLKTGGTNIYFKKFNGHISSSNEFRIFVYKKNITAITTKPSFLNNIDNDLKYDCLNKYELNYIAENIIQYGKLLTKKICKKFDNFVIDIHYNHKNIVLINLKPFGLKMNICTYLFDWIEDRKKLYSDGELIYFRILSKFITN